LRMVFTRITSEIPREWPGCVVKSFHKEVVDGQYGPSSQDCGLVSSNGSAMAALLHPCHRLAPPQTATDLLILLLSSFQQTHHVRRRRSKDFQTKVRPVPHRRSRASPPPPLCFSRNCTWLSILHTMCTKCVSVVPLHRNCTVLNRLELSCTALQWLGRKHTHL
jgi:hypothetical protein